MGTACADNYNNSGGSMNLASLVLRIRPHTRRDAETALAALPGVECHDMTPDGKLIVTVENVVGAAMSDVLIAIQREPLVLATTLAYEYSDGGDQPNSTESPCKETLQ